MKSSPKQGKDNTEFYTGTCCLPCDFLPLTPPPWRNRQANKQRKTEHYNPRPLQEKKTPQAVKTGNLRRIHWEKDTGTQLQGKMKRQKCQRLSITIQMSNQKYYKRMIRKPQVKTNRNPHHPATNWNSYLPTTILNPH